MRCGGCAERRADLGKAVRAAGTGDGTAAAAHVRAVAASLGDEAAAFAAALKARLGRR